MINGKIFQGIGVIYISEIENWDKIRTNYIQRRRIFKNKVSLGKRPQTGTGVVSRVITRLLENVGDVIGL